MDGQCSRISGCSCWSFNSLGSRIVMSTAMQHKSSFLQLFWHLLELPAWASYVASHCNVHWLSFQIMFKTWSLQSIKQHKIFLVFFNFSLAGYIGCFHCVVVDPHCHQWWSDSIRCHLYMILVKEAIMPVLFYKLFWNPPCTNFMEAKSVVDDFIGRTITNLQLVCHVINSHHPAD
jgi:hypothetical protein